MKKNLIKNILIFSLGFVFSFIFFYVLGSIYCDEVWVYGFSYNISRGMVIYRDFNVLQMPLYFMITSIFIKIFGNYIIVMHIFDSILYGLIILMLFRIIKWKVLILLPIFMFFWPSGYNLLVLFFLILIIYLINKDKYNDLLVAFIVGLVFITKQNIGILLFIPCFFYSKKKIKTIIVFLIPFLIVSVYLIFNNAFFEFIDYCFLGMLDFNNKNKYIIPLFLCLFFVNVVILLFKLIKTKFKDKELFYIFFFQLIMYPLFDVRHYICSLFPFLYYILKNINSKTFYIIGFTLVYSLEVSLLFYIDYDIEINKDLSFLRNVGYVSTFSNEVKDYVGDNENFFFTEWYNYYIKLYYDIPISQYDLLLSGNVGYKGMEKKLKKLDKLCSKEKCYFFVCDNMDDAAILGSQYSEFYNYIVNNYEKVDKLYYFDVYTNDV